MEKFGAGNPPGIRHGTFGMSETSGQSILTLDSESEKPKDVFHIVRIILLLLGIGSLLSITTLFTAPDYLELQLQFNKNFKSDQQILYFITPAYISTNLIATIFMIRYGYYTSFQKRIVTNFIITGILLILIPILFMDGIINLFGYKLIFYFIVMISCIIGITNAILSTSILAFCQFLPIKYLRTTIIGQSMAAVLICCIRIGIKLLFGLETGGVIYFAISAGMNILCAILFIYMNTYSRFIAYYLNPYCISKDQRIIDEKIMKYEKKLRDDNDISVDVTKTNTNLKSKTTTNTKTGHSNSIRHSVAIIPSQLSYFSNIQQFQSNKNGERQHPNSPARDKSPWRDREKDKKSIVTPRGVTNGSNVYPNISSNIFYENEDNDQDYQDNTLSMPTHHVQTRDRDRINIHHHQRNKSNSDDIIITKEETNKDDFEMRNAPKHHHKHSSNLNDQSFSSYSIQSHSVTNHGANDHDIIFPVHPNEFHPKESLLSNNAAQSQPNLVKSALLQTSRDHAKSEIVVYPSTFHAGSSPLQNKLSSAMSNSPQTPQSIGNNSNQGYQFNYVPHRPSQHYHPLSDIRPSTSRLTSIEGLRYEYIIVAKKISNPLWNLFITFFMTYLVFPGLILDLESEYDTINDSDWFPVILATEFCIFDLIGRQLTVIPWLNDQCGMKMMNTLSCLRILMYPLFIILDQQLIIEDNIVYIVVGIIAFTNGFFICSAFINVPQILYQHEQEIGAAFMQLSSTLSILCASLIALAVYEIIAKVT